MSTELSQQTVGGLVAERPSRSRIFERLGIDYCCGGKRRLDDVCAEKSVDLGALVHELQDEGAAERQDETDWMTASLSTLIEHIVATHHASLHETLPRLSFLTQKVRDAHGARHPELAELAHVFEAFRADMEAHTQKEELVLFPFVRQLEQSETLPAFCCGSVRNPIQTMEKEHEDAGAALETMRRLTNDYVAPREACNTYRAMLDALAELEADTHRHVHKENSILFPRAQAREADLAARQPSQENGRC